MIISTFDAGQSFLQKIYQSTKEEIRKIKQMEERPDAEGSLLARSMSREGTAMSYDQIDVGYRNEKICQAAVTLSVITSQSSAICKDEF